MEKEDPRLTRIRGTIVHFVIQAAHPPTAPASKEQEDNLFDFADRLARRILLEIVDTPHGRA